VKIRFQVQLEPISSSSSGSSSSSSSSSGGGGFCPTGSSSGGSSSLKKLPSKYQGFGHAFRTIVAEEGIKV
jgi:hypothetical protein